MRTSYSAIETYLQCPQKYKFQEIDRIRVPKSREAIFGTLIHESLKFMFERSPLYPTLDEVVSHFRERWPKHETLLNAGGGDPLKRPWSEAEEKILFEEGVKMLKLFYEKNAPWNFNIVDLESRFEVILADEKTGETHVLAGIIDRIDKDADGVYEIIDYKTSKRMPSQDMLDKNLQLSLYSLGLTKRWPHINIEDIKLSLYFVKHEEKLSTKRTTEQIEKTKAEILTSIQDIQNRLAQNKEFEPMPSMLCNWCEYRPQCPAWRHLYRNTTPISEKSKEEMDEILKEYFEKKKMIKTHETRLAALQVVIKEYMEKEKLTRVFGEEGYISKKLIQRFAYDPEKVKSALSPFGKWEEILKMDETKLKKILKEVPPYVRDAVAKARELSKEYIVMTASLKAIKGPADAADDAENSDEADTI
ncbi:MAG: PD-(D/E)XK nuclease family protein [Candidatus Sungbacteria bacterium]|nr:PD-(D/E)XK nuclease family protein [Candidatus Sungbacteria bacterium]